MECVGSWQARVWVPWVGSLATPCNCNATEKFAFLLWKLSTGIQSPVGGKRKPWPQGMESQRSHWVLPVTPGLLQYCLWRPCATGWHISSGKMASFLWGWEILDTYHIVVLQHAFSSFVLCLQVRYRLNQFVQLLDTVRDSCPWLPVDAELKIMIQQQVPKAVPHVRVRVHMHVHVHVRLRVRVRPHTSSQKREGLLRGPRLATPRLGSRSRSPSSCQ